MVLEFFLKEEGLKNQKIQKVAFPEKMQISFIFVPLAGPLYWEDKTIASYHWRTKKVGVTVLGYEGLKGKV